MRIIKKLVLLVYLILFGFILVIEAPVLIMFWIASQFNTEKPTLYLNQLRNFNKRIFDRLVNNLKQNNSVAVDERNLISVKIDPRPDTLKVLPNEIRINKCPFGKRNIVLYYEPNYQPLINEYLRENHDDIYVKLKNKYIDFIYPNLFKETNSVDLNGLLDYYYPEIENEHQTNKEVIENFGSSRFYQELFGFENLNHPCFIRSTGERDDNGYIYKVYYLPYQQQEIIKNSIDFYLTVVPNGYMPGVPQYSFGGRDLDTNDPDLLFDREISQLSRSLKLQIEKELLNNSTKGALRMLIFLIKQMKEYNIPGDPLMQKFISDIQQNDTPKLSPLVISTTGKILLKDYGKEISLTPLQKTVFIFFILREEGILFKDLPNYKNELMSIYSKVSNRSSLDLISNSINELANPYSNSMSEKCSRIKEAFLKCMDDRLAKYYYVMGDRNAPKRILLNRKLVVFEDSSF